MKRMAMLGVALSLSTGLFAGQASAATYETDVTAGVNFRERPSTNASVTRMISKGEQIHVIEQVNRYWLKIETRDNEVGYISANDKYTNYEPSSTSSAPSTTTAPAPSATLAPSATPAPAGSAAEAIVATANSFVGDFQYKFGAEPWNTSYRYSDCSAFVQLVFNRRHGFSLPRTSLAQSKVGTYVAKSRLAPGDLVFFDTNDDGKINHVGIYTGGGKFVHSSPSNRVGTNDLNSGYWKNRYVTARSVL